MKYRPELDGIRAFAVLAVLAFHSYVLRGLLGGGWLGVDVFFVLSGYLITALLLAEHRRSGRIDFGAFMGRRLVRLYPALLVLLALSAVFYKTIGDDGTVLGFLRTVGAAGLYVENFVWGLGGHELGKLGHTWSLAVEMQFYLVWPLVLGWLLTRKARLVPVVIGAAVISYGLLALESGPAKAAFPVAYYMPWTRAFELLIGALVAITASGAAHREVTPKTRAWVGWVLLGATGFVFLLAATYSIIVLPRVLTWEAPAVALLTAALIVHLNRVRSGGVGALLGWGPLAWLGRVSYGVYLFHYPVLVILRDHGITKGSSLFVLGGAISIALAAASWKLVEQPAQHWSRRRKKSRELQSV